MAHGNSLNLYTYKQTRVQKSSVKRNKVLIQENKGLKAELGGCQQIHQV